MEPGALHFLMKWKLLVSGPHPECQGQRRPPCPTVLWLVRQRSWERVLYWEMVLYWGTSEQRQASICEPASDLEKSWKKLPLTRVKSMRLKVSREIDRDPVLVRTCILSDRGSVIPNLWVLIIITLRACLWSRSLDSAPTRFWLESHWYSNLDFYNIPSIKDY